MTQRTLFAYFFSHTHRTPIRTGLQSPYASKMAKQK